MARRSVHTPIGDDVQIGSRLKETRAKRGVQQKDLAAQLGMDQSALSRYERGEMRLPSSLLARIARALKVSSDEILGLKELKRGAIVRDQRFLKRLQAIDTLPERQKDALLTTIDGLLKSSKAS
jgi:transcriptional regulator with XRE-family HTH domain